jgi:WD40 repeat protein
VLLTACQPNATGFRYPSVAFNTNVQRLAVGNSEGSVVIYDVKTATKYQYLTCFERGSSTAVNFSSDGRFLLSFSLELGKVKVHAQPSSGSLRSMLSSHYKLIKTLDVGIPEKRRFLTDMTLFELGSM